MLRRFLVFIPLLIFFVMGIFLWRGLQLDPSELPSALIDKPMPSFNLSSVYDENTRLSEQQLKGKPALLNVWATWCPTCKQEHEQLNRIAREEGVTIYGINYKDERAKAQDWLTRYEDPYVLNIYDDKGTLGLDLGVYGAPETYILDKDGIIRYRHVGEVNEKVWAKLRGLMRDLERGGS
jgi:cytochrome c biogenesis protein CcmG, thiol:disulfide interchange protein DsbE